MSNEIYPTRPNELYNILYSTRVLPINLDVKKKYCKTISGGLTLKTLEIVEIALDYSRGNITEKECLKKVRLLLDNGADPCIESSIAMSSALYIFIYEKYSEKLIKECFKANGGKASCEIISHTFNDVELFQDLVYLGLDIHTHVTVNGVKMNIQTILERFKYTNILRDIFSYVE